MVKRKLGKKSKKNEEREDTRKDTNSWGKPYSPRLVTADEMTNWNLNRSPKKSQRSFQMTSPFQKQQQKPLHPLKQQIPNQPQPQHQYQEEDEEEPYWSAEEWEEWAIDIYENYPEVRQYLPTWFIEAYQEQ